MNLILWRHAEAEDIAPDHTDAGRRLTARGQKQAAKMAAWLNRHVPDDASVLVSPAIRTRQTADALGRHYEIEPRLFTDASFRDHLNAANWNKHENGTIVMVGHQPTLGQTAAQLMCGAPMEWSVKKGAIWWFSSQGINQPARLVCALEPALL